MVLHPDEFIRNLPAMLGGMWDATKNAGSDPEAFGEMMGQLTGSVEAGLAAGAATSAIKGTYGSRAMSYSRNLAEYSGGVLSRPGIVRSMAKADDGYISVGGGGRSAASAGRVAREVGAEGAVASDAGGVLGNLKSAHVSRLYPDGTPKQLIMVMSQHLRQKRYLAI